MATQPLLIEPREKESMSSINTESECTARIDADCRKIYRYSIGTNYLSYTYIYSHHFEHFEDSSRRIYKTYSKENFLEIIGITGGILKIFQLINDLSAKFLIVIMRRYIKKKAGSFNVMDISPNPKDMSPSIRVMQIKKKKSIEMINMSENNLNESKDIKINI